ncbi:MAG TPA: AI-2E family transporter [Nitrospiraceae bacterium]|nr:AI-2E family transporter [Nitrospiraceae bacterium]
MDGIAVNPAADANPEPQSMQAGSVGACTPVETASLPDPAHLTEPVSIDVRGLALAIVTTVVVAFALQWAEKFFIPLVLGIIIAYTLNPLVVWLERIKIPRVVGTSLVMLAVLGGSAFVTISLRGQIQTILDQLPVAAGKLSVALRSMREGQPNTMQNVQAAAREIDKATSQAADIHSTPKQPATHIVIDQPTFKLGDFLMAGSMGMFGFISQATTVLILVFFLLLAGDTFKRKLVRLTGPSLSDKKITVHILDAIDVSIQRYMFTLLVANVLLALLTWTAFRWIGLDNAGGLAIAAGVLHVIPYLGPTLIAVATGMAGFMQFDSFWMALAVSGSSLAIAIFVGIFVVTWMTGKISKMNPVAVFVSLLFWGWLWGVWGLLLAIPIIGIVKVVSQHIKELQPLAELLRE